MSEKPVTPGAPVPSKPPMPGGIHNVYIYDFFNATSFTAVLGAPMLLFLQHLQATATILAVAAGLAPLMSILQIPAARYVERVGYRRFVVNGWTSRSFFILGMMVVAFLPESFDRATRIVVFLIMVFGFTTLRGISVCGVLPWFTHIVPETRRGEFLSKDQSAVALASILALLFYGMILKGGHAAYSFGIVFTTSAAAAFAGVFFLKRVPDVPVEKIIPNPEPMPWREMFFYPPFFKYIRYNIIVNVALGASGVFWVRFFRAALHLSDSSILLIASMTNLVLMIGLFAMTSLIDRTGNKQVLALSGMLYVCHFTGWAAVAAGLLPFNFPVLAVQTVTAGFAGALWNLANVRCVMGIVPVMGRPHFLALYSVASSIILGTVPLIWGPVMDGLDHWQHAWGVWSWNSYSIFYSALVVTMLVALVSLQSIEEPRIMTWDVFMSELLVKTPSRAISRVISRLRLPGIG